MKRLFYSVRSCEEHDLLVDDRYFNFFNQDLNHLICCLLIATSNAIYHLPFVISSPCKNPGIFIVIVVIFLRCFHAANFLYSWLFPSSWYTGHFLSQIVFETRQIMRSGFVLAAVVHVLLRWEPIRHFWGFGRIYYNKSRCFIKMIPKSRPYME